MFPWRILPGMASTHLVNYIYAHLASRAGFHMSTAKFGGFFPRDLCSCGLLLLFGCLFFPHIHTAQTILVLSAAGPVFPSGTVLTTLGCSCLADWAGNFFPAPNKASVAATMQPSVTLLLLVTKAREGPHWNPYPTPAPISKWGDSVSSHKVSVSFSSIILGYLFFHAGGLFGHKYTTKPNWQKTTVISVPNQYHWQADT